MRLFLLMSGFTLLLQSTLTMSPANSQEGLPEPPPFIKRRMQQSKGGNDMNWDLMNKSPATPPGAASGVFGNSSSFGQQVPGQGFPSPGGGFASGGGFAKGQAPQGFPPAMSGNQGFAGPRRMSDGSTFSIEGPGIQTLRKPDGTQQMLRPDGSFSSINKDGSVFERQADGSRSIRYADGKETVLNPDGTGIFRDGSKISRDDVGKSVSLSRPNGLGLEQQANGNTIFKRSNGLETVRTPEGRIYMRDSKTKQSVGRELK